MSTKRTICIKLEADTVERVDALAATMQTSRSWTISRLIDAALNPAGLSSPAPGDRAPAGDQPSPAGADNEGTHR
jgi:hypothetical protein